MLTRAHEWDIVLGQYLMFLKPYRLSSYITRNNNHLHKDNGHNLNLVGDGGITTFKGVKITFIF